MRGAAIAMLLAPFAVPPATAGAQEIASPTGICPDVRSRAFDFWIGDWDVNNRHRRPDSDDPIWYETGAAVDRVSPIIDGCAVIDYWEGTLTYDRVIGFGMAAFDPARGLWDLALLWPSRDRPTFSNFSGEFRHGRGEFFAEGVDTHGRPQMTRITFADIRPDAFRWDLALSGDSGITWRTSWIQEYTRRDPAVEGPLPAMQPDTTPRCEFPELYEFQFALGRWEGTATLADGTTLPVTLESRQALDACGIEDRMRSADGRWASFEMRTHDVAVHSWVAYRIDTAHPVLQRLEGTVRGREGQFAGTRAGTDGEVLITARWHFGGDTGLQYELRESADGGATWTTVLAAQLHNVQ